MDEFKEWLEVRSGLFAEAAAFIAGMICLAFSADGDTLEASGGSRSKKISTIEHGRL